MLRALTSTLQRAEVLALAAIAAVTVLAGCSSSNPPAPCAAPGVCSPADPGLAVVSSMRANSVSAAWSPQLAGYIAQAVAGRALVSVFSSDGQPRLTATIQIANTGNNGNIIKQQDTANAATVLAKITGSKAVVGQANTLQAIANAALTLSACNGRKILLIIDSGLQTLAPLRFEDGLLNPGTDPKAVASSVAAQGAVPSLAGVDVIWLGLGQTISPQSPLTTPAQTLLQQIWQAVLNAGHPTSVTFVNAALPSTIPVGVPAVAVVPIPPLSSAPVGNQSVTTTPTTSTRPTATHPTTATSSTAQAPASEPMTGSFAATSLGFVADQATFLDRGKALKTVASMARKLVDGGYRHIQITGASADSGDMAGQVQLARNRASAVRALLMSAGVPATHIITPVQGLGSDFPGFLPDRNPDGTLNEDLAAANRLVIVSATD